MVVSHLINNGR